MQTPNENTPNRPKFDATLHLDCTKFADTENIPDATETMFHLERNGVKLPLLKAYVAKRGNSDKAGSVYPAVSIEATDAAVNDTVKFLGAELASGILERALNQRSQSIIYGAKSNILFKSQDGILSLPMNDFCQTFVDWTARGEGEDRVTKKSINALLAEAASLTKEQMLERLAAMLTK